MTATLSSAERYQHQYYMSRAIELAKKGRFTTRPNPSVGCVIVKDNQIIGEGFHYQAGQPHAEVFALRQAYERDAKYLQGATAYVTLEPCTMCAGAILHSRIKRLVFGASDYKTGAVGSRFHFFDDYKMNHTLEITSGVLAEKCGQKLSDFFKKRREQKKEEKREKNLPLDVEPQS